MVPSGYKINHNHVQSYHKKNSLSPSSSSSSSSSSNHQSIFSTFESIRVTLKVQVYFDFIVGCITRQKWNSYKSGLLLIKGNWTRRLKNFKVCLRGAHVFVNGKFHSSNKVLHFGYEIFCCFMNSSSKLSTCNYSICYVSKCCRKIINFFVILEQ